MEEEDNTTARRQFIWKTGKNALEFAETLELRKELMWAIKATQTVMEAVEEGTEAANKWNERQERVGKAKEKLKSNKDEHFLLALENQKKQTEKFFKDMGLTGRGVVVGSILKLPDLLDNFAKAVQQDFAEALLGIAREKRREGFVQNTMWSRIIGADKYFKPEAREAANDDASPSRRSSAESRLNASLGSRGNDSGSRPPGVPPLPSKRDDSILKFVVPILFRLYAMGKKDEQLTFLKKISDYTASTVEAIEALLNGNAREYAERLRDRAERNRKDAEESRERPRGFMAAKAASYKLGTMPPKKEEDDGDFWSNTISGSISGILGGIAGPIFEIFRSSKFGKAVADMGMKSLKTVLSGAKFAARVAAGVLGAATAVIGIAIDGVLGYFRAEDWGVSKTSGIVGSVIGGGDGGVMNAFINAGKWAAAGAAIGSVVPIVGTLIGGLVGAAIGGITGWIGGASISRGIESILGKLDGVFGTAMSQSGKDLVSRAEENLKTLRDMDATDGNFKAMIDTLVNRQKEALKNGDESLAKQIGFQITSYQKMREKLSGSIEANETQLAESIKATQGMLGETGARLSTYFGRIFSGNMNPVLAAMGKYTEEEEEQIKKISEQVNSTKDRIADLNKRLIVAKQSGDTALAKSLEDQIRASSENLKVFESDLRVKQGYFAGVYDDLKSKTFAAWDMSVNWTKDVIQKIGDSLSQSWDEFKNSDFLQSIKDSITGFFSMIGNKVKEMFTWDYWMGGEDAPSAAGPAQTGRAGRYSRKKDEAAAAPDVTSQVRRRNRITSLDMIEANRTEADTRRANNDNSTKQAAQAVAAMTVNNNNVTNNSGFVVDLTSYNNEPSYSIGVGGVRSTTYGTSR